MLIDNADDPDINLQRFLPRSAHGNIIITSRNRDCRLHAPDSHVHVSGMDNEDAVELLLRSAMADPSARNRDIAATICKELGYLALAITQAGAYISQVCSLDDFLKIYHDDRARLLKKRFAQASDDYKWSVYATWEMSVHKLTSTTKTLLQHCAFLHHDGIQRAIFENAAGCAAANSKRKHFRDAIRFLAQFSSESGEWSNERFLDSVRELASYSLINVDRQAGTYSINPLVHTWAREHARPTERNAARICMSQLLALSITRNQSPEALAFRRTLLPHIDKARAGSLDPNVAEWLSVAYSESGRWQAAEELRRPALEARRQLLGDEHPATLISMNNLARTYWNQGKWKDAEKLAVQVMETRKRVLGLEHPDTLRSMNNLATTYSDQGRWKEAEMLAAQVVEASRRVLGHDHPDTLRGICSLATTYMSQGRWREAEVLEAQMMETRKRVLGPDHPDTLTSMNNLAATYSNQGRWKEAEVLGVQVVETTGRVLGLEHPETLTSMNNLATTYREQGQWKEAEDLGVQVVEIRKRVLGCDHPHTLVGMGNLARTYRKQQRLKEAKELDEEVLESQRKVLGDEHPDAIATNAALAQTIAAFNFPLVPLSGPYQISQTTEPDSK